MSEPRHLEIHYWSNALQEPPCGTLEDRFEWSDSVEDVTCELCREALARERGEAESAPDDRPMREEPARDSP